VEFVKSEGTTVEPLPDGCAKGQATWRLPPWSAFLSNKDEDGENPWIGIPGVKAKVPTDEEFKSAVLDIAGMVNDSLSDYPAWRTKLLRYLEVEFGADLADDWWAMDESDEQAYMSSSAGSAGAKAKAKAKAQARTPFQPQDHV